MGKVYMALVWHSDVPTETRAIDHRVMGKLGYRGGNLTPELRATLEDARLNRSPRLRGDAFEEWAKKIVEDNMDRGSADESRLVGRLAASRGKTGALFRRLRQAGNGEEITASTSHGAMVTWINEQGFTDEVVTADH